jgi:hypothetical protein
VLIVGRLDVDGQSFAPIGLHKTELPLIQHLYERLAESPVTKLLDNISCRRNFSFNREEEVTCHLKIRGVSI